MTTNIRIGVGINVDEGSVSNVRTSPDQRYAVIVGSSGKSVVVEFGSAEVVAGLAITQEFRSVGWTSDTEL